MPRVNRQYFVVKIDKKMQEEKRNTLVKKNIGYLGVKHSDQNGDDKLDGVRVWDCDKDSPAYNAGLKHNDIIKEVNGKKVTTYPELAEVVGEYPPGAELEIRYISSFAIHNDEISTKKIVLGERKFELFVPPQIVDFQFNLQFGEVVEMGSIAKQKFPEVELGDMLIFDHKVEHKPIDNSDKNYHDFHLIDTDDNGDEYRVVNYTNELFGVLKLEAGIIIPYKNLIFCHQHIKKASMQQTESGLWFPDAWDKSIEELQGQIDELTATIKEMGASTIMKQRTTEDNYKKKEEIKKSIDLINQEKRKITRKMHQKRLVELTVVFINPLTNEELQSNIQAGDTLLADYNTLYPLDMYGHYYTLLRKDYIEAVIYKSQQ